MTAAMSVMRTLMKISFILALMVWMGNDVKGNDSIPGRENMFFELSPLLPADKGGDAALDLKFGIVKKIDRYFSLGGAIGFTESFKFNRAPMMPLVFRIHAEKDGGDISPFFNFDAGYAFNLQNIEYGNVVINPTIGVAYKRFTFGIGYHGAIATYSQPEGSKSVFSNINLSFGYRFGVKGRGNDGSLDGLSDYFRSVRFYADLGVAIPLAGDCKSEDSAPGAGISLNLSLLGSITDRFSFGITTGYTMFSSTYHYINGDNEKTTDHSFNGEAFVPYALRTRYDFTNVKIGGLIHPYIQMDLGGATSFLTDDMEEMKTIFYYAPSVGFSMDVRDGKSCVDLGLSYSPAVYRDYNSNIWDDYRTKGMLRVGLGYRF